MPEHPNLLSIRPAEADEQADVLADVLDTMRLSNLIYGRFELGAPWGLQVPRSELAHFYVVARGGAQLEVDGEDRTINLSAGDVAVLPSGHPHVMRDAPGSPLHQLGTAQCQRHKLAGESIRLGGDGARSIVIAGAFQFLSGRRTCLLERLPAVIHLPSNDPKSAPWLPATVQLLVAESVAYSPGSSVVVSRLADVLLVQALRSQMAEGPCREHGLRSLKDPQNGKALGLMHARPHDPWTVESLAESVGQSRSGFAARFTELVGEPPLQYLARWRMTKAAQALRESDTSIIEIAERVGYMSEASFNKAFKRWEGTGPGAYRRAHRKGGEVRQESAS